MGDDKIKTLGDYLMLSKMLGFKKAIAYFEKKIAESPNGKDEKVLADESQMLILINSME